MKSQFTKKRLKKFLSYYRPIGTFLSWICFSLPSAPLLLFCSPFCPVTLQDSDIVKIS